MTFNKKIFPASVLEQSSEITLYNLSRPSHIIYIIVLAVVIITLIAIFFIQVNVSVKATAQIKPIGERLIITAPMTGKLRFIHVIENNAVCVGDTVAIIQAHNILSKLPALETHQKLLMQFIRDINTILSSHGIKNLYLQSKKYTAQHEYHISKLKRLLIKYKLVEKDYKRASILFKEKVIAPVDLEKIKTEYETAVSEISIYKREYTNQLESEIITHQKELLDIKTQIHQIQIQNEETVITSPIQGNIVKIFGISDGSYIQTGQQLVEISPEGELMVECSVYSKDIGYISVGQKVNIQIDAFNYNEWGMLEGKVVDIYDDIYISADKKNVYFKVYCSLNSKKLYLKNGFSGSVKKGMSAYVIFIITKRSLANLLYDKLDNWLNPNVKQ